MITESLKKSQKKYYERVKKERNKKIYVRQKLLMQYGREHEKNCLHKIQILDGKNI